MDVTFSRTVFKPENINLNYFLKLSWKHIDWGEKNETGPKIDYKKSSDFLPNYHETWSK